MNEDTSQLPVIYFRKAYEISSKKKLYCHYFWLSNLGNWKRQVLQYGKQRCKTFQKEYGKQLM